MTPTVDVVVLSWNRREDTMETIRSVLDQVGVSPRVWVVDQGSVPEQVKELRKLAARHEEVRLIELDRNVGVPAGRNIGIRQGAAEWVVSLDNDSVFASRRALAMTVERLSSSPRLGALAFRAENYITGDLDEASWAYPASLKDQREPVRVTRFVGVGHALRRSAFDFIGGYDARLFFCEEELDLSYRLIERGYEIVYDPAIVVLHKGSPEMRIGWGDLRVYYQTRNAVLVHHRHHRRLRTTLLVAGGWLLRAAFNQKTELAWRGIRDAMRLWDDDYEVWPPLNREARRYIRSQDTRIRGPWPHRLRREILAGLPEAQPVRNQP